MSCTKIIMNHDIKVDPRPGAVYVKHKGRKLKSGRMDLQRVKPFVG